MPLPDQSPLADLGSLQVAKEAVLRCRSQNLSSKQAFGVTDWASRFPCRITSRQPQTILRALRCSDYNGYQRILLVIVVSDYMPTKPQVASRLLTYCTGEYSNYQVTLGSRLLRCRHEKILSCGWFEGPRFSFEFLTDVPGCCFLFSVLHVNPWGAMYEI